MDKKRIMLSVLILMISSIMLPQGHSIPTGQGQQLFFDNFSTSQLSPNWSPAFMGQPFCSGCNQLGNITQSGGWLTLTMIKSLLAGNCANGCFVSSGISANAISPIISTSTTNQFIFAVWRIVPFNLTQIGNNPGVSTSHRDAGLALGFMDNNFNGFGIEMSEVDDISDSNLLAPNSQREAIALFINAPQTGTTTPNCYANSFIMIPINIQSCTGHASPFIYSNPQNPIDLNTVHVFTIEANLQNTGGGSWIALQVDQNAWYNVTQTACTCIESTTHVWRNMFPFIQSSYASNNIASSPPIPNQSLGTYINYVLIDNYVPSTLPQGLPPPLNPSNNPLNIPQTNNPISNPFGGISPSNLWQYFANVIGQGVPEGGGNFLMSKFYFGGSVLFAITVIVILVSLLFTPVGRVTSPFVLSFILFIDTIANFVLGTLPPWIFAGVLIFFMAVMVGTIPSVIGGRGKGGTM